MEGANKSDQQFLELTIVAKTILGIGFCYIGYSHKDQRLFRPIYDKAYFNWRSDRMKVGESYRFRVLSMPMPSPEASTLPHSKDDVVVVCEFPQLISSTHSVNTNVVTERMGNMTVKENELPSEGSSSDSNNPDLGSSEIQSDLAEKPLGASNIVEDAEKLPKKTEPTESIDDTSAAFEQKDELPSKSLSTDLGSSEMQSGLVKKPLGASNIVDAEKLTVGKDSILFEQLSKLGKTTLEDIFGAGNILGRKMYVAAGTDCPSVGILKCASNCISIQDEVSFGKIQKRVFIKDVTDLPLSKGVVSPTILPATNALLVIGLAREGWPKYPDRCFLMVVGIFFL